MRLRKFGRVAGLTSCLVWLSASAQHTDQSFTTTSEDCAGVRWSDRVLKQYPTVVPACQSVESHGGVTYVKFSATVVRTKNGGKDLTLALKDGGEVTVAMPPKTKLFINGRATPTANLERGDKLNFYVPQSRAVAEFYPENTVPTPSTPVVTAPFKTSVAQVSQ